MFRPLLLLAVAFGSGAALGGDVGPGGALVLLVASAVALGAAVLRYSPWSTAALVASALGIGAAAAGLEVAAYEKQPLRVALMGVADPEPRPWLLEGVARGDARDTADRFSVVLDLAAGALPGGRVRIEVGGLSTRPEILDGDRVRLFASLRRPRGFRNPGAYDVVAAARHAGVVAIGYCKSPQLVTILGRGEVGLVRDVTARARQAARRAFRRWILAGPEEGLVRAMVLGDRTGVEPDTAEAFREAGTFHVLALSGAQVALLAGILVATLRLARASPVTAAIVTAFAIAVYAVLVGGEVPVVRAAVMAIVVVTGRALDLEADLSNLLGLAALALLAHRPSNVFDVGFQLSFGATLGLLLLTAPFLALLPRLPLRVDAGLAGSLAAQTALLPLLANQFHRLTPAAVVLNLLAVPLSAAVLLSGLGVLAVAWSPIVAPWAGDLAWIFAHALLRSCEPASWLPGLDPRVATPPLVAVLIYTAGVVSLARGQAPSRSFGLLALGLAWTVIPRTAVGDGRLRLTVLDVGQGDGLVLRSPSGRVRLVDAGGTYDSRFDIGEAVVGPYLWSQGIARLDGIVVTHAHADHAGGVGAIVRGFQVGDVWEGPAPRQDRVYDALDEVLTTARINRRSVARGMWEAWDGVVLRVLGPVPAGQRPWRTRNDDSVVLEIVYGDVRLLLTGDVEAGGEVRLKTGRVQIAKVPHHGSRSSSSPEFVERIEPRLALVSAGFRNRFGHPHPTVVARYRRHGRFLSTAEEGALSVSTDGQRIWVSTYEGVHEERLR